MDIYTEIKDKLDIKKLEKIKRSNAQGCISSGSGFHTDKGDIFVKMNNKGEALPMFCGELNSLQALRQTQTIKVPKPLCIVSDPKSCGGAIVLEYLTINPVTEWAKLGSDLAELHLFNMVLQRKKSKLESWIGKPPKDDLFPDYEMSIEKQVTLKLDDELVASVEYVDDFGFKGPTYCGVIVQNNEWNHDWIQFYARNRLDYQINLLAENYGDREVLEYWSQLQLKVDYFFKEIQNPIKPALLHGDLWSGNVAQVDNVPVVFDPASFYGHSEYDLAIAKLFGGFDSEFYKTYFEKIPQERGFAARKDLYTLFHTLNHWNHFGTHVRQTKQIMKRLIDLSHR